MIFVMNKVWLDKYTIKKHIILTLNEENAYYIKIKKE